MHVTPVLHILHNSSEGMFLCLPEELYILSSFFVRHIHSDSAYLDVIKYHEALLPELWKILHDVIYVPSSKKITQC